MRTERTVLPADCDLDPEAAFSVIPPYRAGAAAYRLVYVGELSPSAGAADLQSVVAQWAERYPCREIELTWVGDGDFRAVLDAQPLPANMRQRFLGIVRGAALAEVFQQCGLLVMPDFFGRDGAPLRQAAIAGLPVIGSCRHSQIGTAVVHGETGWLFDPLVGGSMFDVLDRALSTPIDRLNSMRLASKLRSGIKPVEQDDGAQVAVTSEGRS